MRSSILQATPNVNSIQLIDVRTPSEYEQLKLPNSLNIPLEQLKEAYESLNFKEPIYFICQSGTRSRVAAQMLLEYEPTCEAHSIIGGVDHYMSLC
jgi:adenylyltransferase/sulfurtransferase